LQYIIVDHSQDHLKKAKLVFKIVSQTAGCESNAVEYQADMASQLERILEALA